LIGVPADLLFNDGHLGTSLDEHARKLVAEVEAAPADHVLQTDAEEWAAALVRRWSVQVPELDVDAMWQDEPKEVQIDVRHDGMRAILDYSQPAWWPGFRVTVHIPFTGEADVFRLRPNSYTYNPPRANVGPNEITEVIEYPHERPVDIAAHARGLIGTIEQWLGFARNEIEQFNGGLLPTARNAINTRRQRIEAHKAHVAQTGLPVGPPSERGKTYIADAIIRRPAPVLPSLPASKPVPLEPVLADEIFEHILGVIRSAGADMERSPGTYTALGEEDLRQTLLMALNTHYRGQTMAEAFNVSGKTDLLVRFEGQNLFIGECKFWSGPKGFVDTVGQIFRYTAWRDTKLAVVMFVRERDLTTIVEKARQALAEHPQFVAWVEGDKRQTDTELRATVSWSGDEERRADLAVFLIHFPTKS
jgi:hypothetical protein